jgi:hypothetical protein
MDRRGALANLKIKEAAWKETVGGPRLAAAVVKRAGRYFTIGASFLVPSPKRTSQAQQQAPQTARYLNPMT